MRQRQQDGGEARVVLDDQHHRLPRLDLVAVVHHRLGRLLVDRDRELPRRRRARRGGRSRRGDGAGALEATFDHGEEGYGLWLDPAVADNPVYAEHWAGHRPVEVTIEEDQIVIRRAGATGDDD
ncbi:MAG TPA: hypothetical protein VHF89_05505 [Solirubrobacteraceae bacterium]|nr:hypothetical protein [Solirubrobacteraceae bacterium]